MKHCFVLLFSVVLCSLVFSQPPRYGQRTAASNAVQAMQRPYTYADTIDVSSVNWTAPDSIIICELHCTSQGRIKLGLDLKDSLTLPVDDYDVVPVNCRKIYKVGTDSLLRVSCISVFGFKR